MKEDKSFIPKKGKPTKLSIQKSEQSDIPEDLQKKWQAVEAAATACHLLQEGHFKYAYNRALGASIAFLQALHQNCVEECLKHPKAELIPELKAELEKQKDVKDGKEETK